MGAGYHGRNRNKYFHCPISKIEGVWEKGRADHADGKAHSDRGKAKGEKGYIKSRENQQVFSGGVFGKRNRKSHYRAFGGMAEKTVKEAVKMGDTIKFDYYYGIEAEQLHNVSNEEAEEYKEYIEEQLAVTKLFCAFHEAYHLKKIDAPGDVNYRERILYNVKTMVNSKEFEVYYAYDRRLIDDVRKRVNLMNEQDNLFDELYSDAAALDLLDVVLNYMNVFQPQWSMEKFSLVVKEMIENFYAFNTLTYDLYMIWNANINLLNGQITEDVYEQEVHERDVEDVIRGQIFPAILWIQIDNILSEKGKLPPIPKKRCVNVKKEMVNFFNIAYNDELKNAVCSAVKQGFCKSKLTIEEARDILIEWDELGKFSNAKVDDLFLKGGIDDETDFFMFVRGY